MRILAVGLRVSGSLRLDARCENPVAVAFFVSEMQANACRVGPGKVGCVTLTLREPIATIRPLHGDHD